MSSASPTSNVELSYSGYEFLTSIFDKYDSDKDKALNPQVRLCCCNKTVLMDLMDSLKLSSALN